MSILKGPRIELRTLAPTLENAAMVSMLVDENVAHLSKNLPFFPDTVKTPEMALDVLRYQQQKQAEGLGLYYYIFVQDKMIGEIHTTGYFYSDKSEATYWLSKNAEKKGYMQEALTLVEAEHFEHSKTMLVAVILPTATRSALLLQKMKYIRQGPAYYKTRQMYLEQQSPKCIQSASKRIPNQLKKMRGTENIYP